jgi:hypothetical protein
MGRQRVEAVVVLVNLSSTGHSRRVLTMTTTTSNEGGGVDGRGGQCQQEDGTCLPVLWRVANDVVDLSLTGHSRCVLTTTTTTTRQ